MSITGIISVSSFFFVFDIRIRHFILKRFDKSSSSFVFINREKMISKCFLIIFLLQLREVKIFIDRRRISTKFLFPNDIFIETRSSIGQRKTMRLLQTSCLFWYLNEEINNLSDDDDQSSHSADDCGTNERRKTIHRVCQSSFFPCPSANEPNNRHHLIVSLLSSSLFSSSSSSSLRFTLTRKLLTDG